MGSVRVILVDDQEVVRFGLKAVLEIQMDIEVVGDANGGVEALQLIKNTQPDVVIMEAAIPGFDSSEAITNMKGICPGCKILVLTAKSDKQSFVDMMAAGAMGYMTKQASADELVAAIRTIAIGNVFLQPSLETWLVEDYRRLLAGATKASSTELAPSLNKELEVLSAREVQVLKNVADGLNNQDIGVLLGISPKTVARHRERIMSKLDIHSTSELIRFAIHNGLILLK